MISTSNKAGWVVASVSISDPPNMTDEYIAEKYGKGRSILLTTDKEAYLHNVENGFVGYIAYGDKPSKADYGQFLPKFREMMANNKRKDVEGYILLVNNKTGEYEKKLLPSTKKKRRRA
jgi:hypothetical protein